MDYCIINYIKYFTAVLRKYSITSKLLSATVKKAIRNMTSVESIREKFKNGEYSVENLPTLLAVDYKGVVFINPDIPNPDIIDQQERWKNHVHIKELVQMPKLKATCCTEFAFRAVKVPKDYFDSRESFEEMVIETRDRDIGSACIKVDSLSLRTAIKEMKVDMFANMDYYLQNRIELDTDLGRNISSDLDSSDELLLKTLEQELFYKLMCKIFGNDSTDDNVTVDGEKTLYDKSYMINDFRILSFDGNSMFAAARRSDNYLMLCFNY